MLENAKRRLYALQDKDKLQPALFRVLVKKRPEDLNYMEQMYIDRYRVAFVSEVVVLAHIPLAVFFLIKCSEKMTPSYQKRKSFRFAFAFVLMAQLNLALFGQYYRKVKRYPFEDRLLVQYFHDIKNLGSENKPQASN